MASGPVVLIIEDSSELRHELRNVMTDILRLEVAEAGDLRAAVELFAGGLRPDLALVDFDGVAGGEVAAWLQRTHADLPVVAMSREDCRDHAKHPGCDDVLPKPFLLEELVNVLKRWLPARR